MALANGEVEIDASGKPIAYTNWDNFTVINITCSVPGTAEQGSSVTVPDGMVACVQALASNTDEVTIANTKAEAETDSTAIVLQPGDVVELRVRNFSAIWCDATVAGEGVEVSAESSS